MLDDQTRPPKVHADQLEVSPDGATLYFQPASGPMANRYALATIQPSQLRRWLSMCSLLLTRRPRAEPPSTRTGLCMCPMWTAAALLRITRDGAVGTLVSDPRLVWVGAMWIDSGGILWMSAAQLNLTHGMLRWPFRRAVSGLDLQAADQGRPARR